MEDVREPSPLAVYLNFWQDPKEQRYPVLLVRGVNDVQSDGRAIGIAVQSLGREYIEEFRSLAAQRDEAMVEDRLLAYLSSIFGLLGLLLAAIGLFAILSCYVSRRMSEIGVRMALGAHAAQIGILVLRQIGFVVLAGIMAGLGLALVVGRMLGSVAYGVTPRNPLLLGGAALALMLTAFAAALIPARRATSIQPLAALRHN
jgi:ABC-type antimicrobial peptide transport system permease subunit